MTLLPDGIGGAWVEARTPATRTVCPGGHAAQVPNLLALRRSGFRTAVDLAASLTAEADRRTRDVFGRTGEAHPDHYARAWLAAAVYLDCVERALVRSTWQPETSSN